MNVAIIGAGRAGKALGSSLLRAGHGVTYASKGDGARQAALAGGTAAASAAAAVAPADLVILAIPWGAVAEVAAQIAPVVAGKVVIDATNPLTPDFSRPAFDGGPSGAERVAALLPAASVAKALNTVFAAVQADPATHGVTIDALFAADDGPAKAAAGSLLRSIGFRPVHVGPLARSRELEALAYLNIAMQMALSGDWRTSVNLVGAPAAATAGTA